MIKGHTVILGWFQGRILSGVHNILKYCVIVMLDDDDYDYDDDDTDTVMSLTTGLQRFSERVFHRVKSSACHFGFQRPSISLRLSSLCLRLFRRLLVTYLSWGKRILESRSYARCD